MIRKLRLRFIIAALASILFVLAATIAAINVSNHIKTENETTESLNNIIEYSHQNALMMNGVMPNNQQHGPDQQGGPGGQGQPDGELGGQGQPGGYFYPRREEINEQYFVTVFDENGSIEWYDYSHIAPGDSDDELRQVMSTRIYNSGEKEGTIGKLRFKVASTDETAEVVTGWEMNPEGGQPITEERELKFTYVAFLDTSERTHAFNNFFMSSMVIAAISYTVLAILIILSSKLVFRTSEESYKKQKAFITNASHELKTPLTIISTDLELVEMDHGKSEWTESIHDQVIRLNTMTKQLVTLSRLDEGNANNYPFAEFSLSKLASESVDSFAPTFKSKQLSFNSDIPSDINMKGNMYLINELFYIFFDNALKYTKSNGEASLTIKKNQNKKIEITFSNDIEDNEMDTEQLFERFYRSPNSVSKEGSGIGLSIAKEIVELHKGKISVTVKENRIYFVIVL